MKIIDKFIIKAFIGPFIVAFGIALFVLVMQFLWVYIDELMGKGLGIFELTELIFYLSMTVVPSALPIGVLISTVMVMGNLAEKYELSSFKSAGVSLVRVMRPLFYMVVLITLGSIFISDKVIPWANLQFHSRFYDIRKSKPTLTLVEGVFNDEFADYTLRIGKKGRDGKSLNDVTIYGNKNRNTNLINQSKAKTGEMYTTSDNQYIVMNLFDGTQFQETANNEGGKNTYPFVRIKFKSWQKIFDLTQFDRQKTDQDLFKKHQKMSGIVALQKTADSIRHLKENLLGDMMSSIRSNFTPFRQSLLKTENAFNTQDSLSTKPLIVDSSKVLQKAKGPNLDSVYKIKYSLYNYIDTIPIYEQAKFYAKARELSENIKVQAENTRRQLEGNEEQAGKYIYEMHLKFSFAAVCLVFLFIGAPMGAIIQKGGFGVPILVAIVFFIIFIVSNIYCKNLKDTGSLSAVMAAWTPILFQIPFAAVLTWRAVNDYKMLNFDPMKIAQKLNPKNWNTSFLKLKKNN